MKVAADIADTGYSARTGRCLVVLAAALLSAAPCVPGRAQEPPARALSGTLQKIAASGIVAIGYRASAFPFSYADARDRPLGYALDLCAGIVEEIAREVDRPTVRTAYRAVTAEDRIPRLLAGDIDLECGATTSNAERQKLVAFSPVTFVTGTKLLVRRNSGIRSYRDLAGKVIVTTAGTTNDAALRRLVARVKLSAEIVSTPDHELSYRHVADGRADAFATDEVLLYGLIARHRAQRSLMVVGEFLSYEAFGIMFRKDDPQLAEAVGRAFRTMAERGDLGEYYHRWFIRRTPGGERLNLPMTAQLAEIFRLLGAPD